MALIRDSKLCASAAALAIQDQISCFPVFTQSSAVSASACKMVASFGLSHQFGVLSAFLRQHQKFIDHVNPFASTQRLPYGRGHPCAASFKTSFPTPFEEVELDFESVPKPRVIIDQDSDPHATLVELSFGDRLGALLDTVRALKELGLNVVKGTVFASSLARNKFSITQADTGRKIEDPELLEAIRLTIISNLLQYHPESSEQLAMGEAFGLTPPKEKLDINVATHISIKNDGPKRSLLTIKTADRPGLLMEIVKIISDTSVAVESGEVETEGLIAKDKLHVSYQGAALSKSMEEVLTNCLRYYLRRPEIDVDSY